MTKLWGLLRSMVSGMPGSSASPAARTQALVQGARAYLAQGHADYLRSIVQGNRAQVCFSLQLALYESQPNYNLHLRGTCHSLHWSSGDSTGSSIMSTVSAGKTLLQACMNGKIHYRPIWEGRLRGWTGQKAFLRVKEKDRGPLDFDVPGGGDTTWQRVYLCLRSGYDAEAIEVLITPAAVWFILQASYWLTCLSEHTCYTDSALMYRATGSLLS